MAPSKDQRAAGTPLRRKTTAARRPVPMTGHALLLALQRGAGNAAVTEVVQRYAEPAKPGGVTPTTDQKFIALKSRIGVKAKAAKSHPTARADSKEAADAAVAPAEDKESQAKAAKADSMSQAKAGGFDKAGFIAAVKEAIAAQAPKNLDEADKFAESGKADAVKGQVAGKVTEGKQKSTQDLAEQTAAEPDTSKAIDKPVTPLVQPPPAHPGAVDAAAGMPSKAPPEQTDFSGGKKATDQKMAEAGVTEQQLANSNEPQFTGALDAKKEGEQHSATAPGEIRTAEAAKLSATKQGAQAEGKTGLSGLAGAKGAAQTKNAAAKAAQKAKDEAKRAEIALKIKGIFDATKADVDGILTALDGEVAKRFDAGEKEARTAFTADHKARMARYRDERYSGASGALAWAHDLFAGLPAEANRIYDQAKKVYESKMETVISNVADFIGAELTRAKTRIADGRQQIKTFVGSQPKELQKVANEAATQYTEQFDQLESDVDSKKDALVQDLANKYVEARNAVDEEIKAEQDANKGLWDKAVEAVGGAIETILKLKDMLLNVLARAASAVEKIIKDPIGFLGNLVNAVGQGIQNFGANILTHLKKGLQSWLLGSLAEGGIEIPEKFDLKGIIKLVLSILGLTWANIRARIVKKIPESIMDKVEKGVGFIQSILSGGIGALWTFIAEKLSDLQEMVMSKVKEFVVTKIITAGITWLISLLNPAATFIKACKMIVDVVMFFVDRAQQIKEFIDTVLDSVESIVGGGVGAVAGKIEAVLAKILPLVIGFLASLLGLGGISEKIKSILQTIQKPINKVIDKLVAGAVKFGKKLLKGAKSLGKKALGELGFGKKKDTVPGAAKPVDAPRAAAAVANAAKQQAGRSGAAGTIKAKAIEAGAEYLGGKGDIHVKGVPTVQRTTAEIEESPVPHPASPEVVQVRGAQPVNADSAAKILKYIELRMPDLLKQFAAKKNIRDDLDKLEVKFQNFMAGKQGRPLTAAERRAAMNILTPARGLSREYYNKFRDFAWSRLNGEPGLTKLTAAPGSHAQAGTGERSLRIEVVVTKADGTKVTEYRTVDFEHITRVTDQPFTRHSGTAGERRNLTPMLADLNRYYQEALRNISGAHEFGGDEIERFIVSHQLYAENSPAARPDSMAAM